MASGMFTYLGLKQGDEMKKSWSTTKQTETCIPKLECLLSVWKCNGNMANYNQYVY